MTWETKNHGPVNRNYTEYVSVYERPGMSRPVYVTMLCKRINEDGSFKVKVKRGHFSILTNLRLGDVEDGCAYILVSEAMQYIRDAHLYNWFIESIANVIRIHGNILDCNCDPYESDDMENQMMIDA